MTVLELDAVWKEYGRGGARTPALSGVTLRVARSERVVLVGASGSGKTTLLNLAAGLDRADRGAVRLLGRELGELREAGRALWRQRQVGFVFQMLNLLPTLTARENVELPLAINGVRSAERRVRVAELLAAAGLTKRASAFPEELSVGEQQRVAVLRAVAHRPAVVFLDEPTSSLDTAHAEELMELVAAMSEREETTVMAATHDVRITRFFTRTVQLSDGRVVQDSAENLP